MLDNLPALDDEDEFVNALYFGEYGSGKSTAAAHLAKLGPTIYINAEGGVKKKPLRKLGVPIPNIRPVSVKGYDELDRLIWQIKAQLDSEPGSIAGVVMDSATEVTKKFVENLVLERYGKAEKLAQRSGASNPDDPFFTDRDEYGRMTEQMRRLCRRLRDLPCHVVFTTLAKREVDNDGVFYRPALTPKFAEDLLGYVDVAIYTGVGDGDEEDRSRFTGITRNLGKYRGKDRFGALPPQMANPTFDRVLEYIESDHLRWQDHAAEDPYQTARARRLAGEEPEPEQNETDDNGEQEQTASE